MKNKYNKVIVIDRHELNEMLRKEYIRGNNELNEAHRKILSKISAYINRFSNESKLTRGDIVFILKEILK